MRPFTVRQGKQHSIIKEHIIADGVFGFIHSLTLGKQSETSYYQFGYSISSSGYRNQHFLWGLFQISMSYGCQMLNSSNK